MTFSERLGIVRKALQVESMGDALRYGLWNALYVSYRDVIYDEVPNTYLLLDHPSDHELRAFAEKLWREVEKWPLPNWKPADTLNREMFLNYCKNFILKRPWHSVYDLVEFFPNHFPAGKSVDDAFRTEVDRVLETENAGYRFLGRQLTPITAAGEITEVAEALQLGGPFESASTNLGKALQLLSNRETPDYPNTIKESISAVEAACRVVSRKPKATLGDALKAVGDETIHPALRKAFDNLYGWTNDEGGIRHAMTEDARSGLAEARFMVVACSAFTNYLAAKYASPSG